MMRAPPVQNLRPRHRLGRVAWLGLAAAGTAGSLVLWSFAGFLARIDDSAIEPARHADGAVALTGGADRIAGAIELLVAGRVDRLLITGVNPMTTRSEIARQQPGARAFFDCCIELGYEAANTVGNAVETERWVRMHRMQSLVVVTSNYHMPRALAEIASALPDIDLLPYPVVPDRSRRWWFDAQSTRLVLTEYAKYLAARVRLQLTSRQNAPGEETSMRAGPESRVSR